MKKCDENAYSVTIRIMTGNDGKSFSYKFCDECI